MISLIMPCQSKTRQYTENAIKNIQELYPDTDKVELIVREDDIATLGQNYNAAVKQANGEKIILVHNDMVFKPGFVETMDRHIVPGRITTYTRIEPPIYPDTYPGKIIYDCGTDLESFNKDKWNNCYIEETLVDGGSQLFFGCMKADYIGIDGDTFKLFCEDDDIHLRYRILNFEKKVSSAHVYHFVSKTSRASEEAKQIERESNKAFQQKWNNILYIK